jgi:hypothetical protein
MSIHQFCHTGAGRYPVFSIIFWIPVLVTFRLFTGMTSKGVVQSSLSMMESANVARYYHQTFFNGMLMTASLA